MSYSLYNIDLKQDEQSYACFEGWFLSIKPINNSQKNSLINFLKNDFENLNIKTFDGEGEAIADYCDEFKYFGLDLIG